MMRFRLLLIISFLFLFLSKSQGQKEKMSSQLQEQLQQNETADFWVIMRNQHRVEWPDDRYISKEEKAQMAYAQLRDHARKTQSSIMPLIKKRSEDYKSHFLVNVVYVK